MQYGETIAELTWINPTTIIYQGYKTKLTPMIEQYIDAKKQNPTMLLLFRMGDFYETFFEDAKIISRALDLTLTSRNKNEDGEDLPMAGVPFRSINEYLFQLVEQGFKVAVCDQLEDPAQATGIVRRGITQIVTPGTLCDERPGNDRNARFLTAIVWHDISRLKTSKKAEVPHEVLCALASIDVSTGYCTMTELTSHASLQAELMRLNTREVISHHTAQDATAENLLRGIPIAYRERDLFSQQALIEQWLKQEEEGLPRGRNSKGDGAVAMMSREKFLTFINAIETSDFDCPQLVIEAFCGLLLYLCDLHYPLTANIEQIYPYRAEKFMQIDAATFQNLEIYATLRGGQKAGSLLGELDDTVTSPGARLLQNWLAYPLKDLGQIKTRHDAVEALVNHYETRQTLRKLLQETADLERISTKLANDRIVPRELVMLKKTLQVLPEIIERCKNLESGYFKRASERLNPLEQLAETIEAALKPDAPSNLNDTDFFNPGYDEKLDHYREVSENGQQWLLDYEANQKQETGIVSLKVKYHRVFGYFIEVSKAHRTGVPEHYTRSQTLTNCERFYTPELKEYEEELLTAAARRSERELELFVELKKFASAQLSALVYNARILAHIDVLASLAHTAHHRQYTRPQMEDDKSFYLKNARHPVVERFLPRGERFVPNDIELNENGRLVIITGPNMAGKSTIIRQAAIITLMAQMGSFVPAEQARIGLVDRIFSRVGASDNLALGQSTFMVEMTETANILKHATDKSLVILDEIGRGTSTYDGLSLAWAIAEYLHTQIKARALFATHYHELTELSNTLESVKNASVAVKEYQNDIIFLRKLIDGAANRSYGIQVARLAGIPCEVLSRAEEILEMLEQNAHRELTETVQTPVQTVQKRAQRSLFDDPDPSPNTPATDPRLSELLHDLNNLSLDATTPIQALNWLYKWQKKLKL